MSLDSAIEFPNPRSFPPSQRAPDDLRELDNHMKPRPSGDSDDSGIQFREYDSPDVANESRHHRGRLPHFPHSFHHHHHHGHGHHHSHHRQKKKRESYERTPSSHSGDSEAFASVVAYAERKRRKREGIVRNIQQLEERRQKDEAYALSFVTLIISCSC